MYDLFKYENVQSINSLCIELLGVYLLNQRVAFYVVRLCFVTMSNDIWIDSMQLYESSKISEILCTYTKLLRSLSEINFKQTVRKERTKQKFLRA